MSSSTTRVTENMTTPSAFLHDINSKSSPLALPSASTSSLLKTELQAVWLLVYEKYGSTTLQYQVDSFGSVSWNWGLLSRKVEVDVTHGDALNRSSMCKRFLADQIDD